MREGATWGIEGLGLGISLGGATRSEDWAGALAWVERAEALGLHSVWMPEMHFTRGGNSSPLLDLSAFAARSRRLRLATTSLLLPIHHPLRVAREVALLDHLSGGRVILGLGRGFREPMFSAFGVDPASKRDRFDESLDLILRSWQGETIRVDGVRFASLRPLQRPHPPLAVAAFGRKGLAQAAARGLPYLASPVEPLAQIVENQKFHRDRLPADVDADALITPVMRIVFVAADEATARRVKDRLAADNRRPAGARLPAAIAEALASPIEQRVLVGGPQEVLDGLAVYRERLRLDLLVVRPEVPGVSHEECDESLERLACEIVPALTPRLRPSSSA